MSLFTILRVYNKLTPFSFNGKTEPMHGCKMHFMLSWFDVRIIRLVKWCSLFFYVLTSGINPMKYSLCYSWVGWKIRNGWKLTSKHFGVQLKIIWNFEVCISGYLGIIYAFQALVG